MATKRIGRTIIECGRGKHAKFARRVINRGKRRWRLVDGEYEPGKYVNDYRELRDDLAVLVRWLKAHVGQRWDGVFSKFCAREDSRSLRGDHIHRHLKEMVKGAGGREYFSNYYVNMPPCRRVHGIYDFWIDSAGILRHHSRQDCEAEEKRLGWTYRRIVTHPTYEEMKAERIARGELYIEELREHLRLMDERSKAD